MKYQIVAAEACAPLAQRLAATFPDRFTYHPTSWGKFPDNTDNIVISGFTPYNLISGEHVLFLASFHDNDVTLSQYQVRGWPRGWVKALRKREREERALRVWREHREPLCSQRLPFCSHMCVAPPPFFTTPPLFSHCLSGPFCSHVSA